MIQFSWIKMLITASNFVLILSNYKCVLVIVFISFPNRSGVIFHNLTCHLQSAFESIPINSIFSSDAWVWYAIMIPFSMLIWRCYTNKPMIFRSRIKACMMNIVQNFEMSIHWWLLQSNYQIKTINLIDFGILETVSLDSICIIVERCWPIPVAYWKFL